MSRALFPACASFGPLFMTMGCLLPNRSGQSWGFLIALPGALMTATALQTLFRMLCDLERMRSVDKPSTESTTQDPA